MDTFRGDLWRTVFYNELELRDQEEKVNNWKIWKAL